MSYPIRVHFAGFESDTFRLQKAGWQISMENFAEYDRDGYRSRLAMKHEGLRQYALTNQISLGREWLAALHFGDSIALQHYYRSLEFHVVCVAPGIQFQVMPMRHEMSFTAIDCTPQMVETKIVDLEKVGMFRPIALSEDAEIYVPEHSVAELLEIIKKKQEPAQKELREKRRAEKMREDTNRMHLDDLDGYAPQRDIRAQILSVAV